MYSSHLPVKIYGHDTRQYSIARRRSWVKTIRNVLHYLNFWRKISALSDGNMQYTPIVAELGSCSRRKILKTMYIRSTFARTWVRLKT